MRIAYFTNRYPAVSHTFIRREIRALEALDVTVVRYALRSGEGELPDPDDQREKSLTKRILPISPDRVVSAFSTLLRRPGKTATALALAVKMGRRSDRGLLRHLAYLVEATIMADWCVRDRVEHLHAHFGTNSAAIAMLCSQIITVPFSFTLHGQEDFENAISLSLHDKLQRAAFAVCVSWFGRSQLMLRSTPNHWTKIHLVRCGVDGRFLQAPINHPDASTRLVCLGRLCKEKAQLTLVRAAALLRDRRPDFQLILVGDGPMKKQIESAINDLRLQDQIVLTGSLSGEDVRATLESARALVLPSFSENLPLAIVEALAMRRPVISTFIAGIPELVQPGLTGWLVPASDEAALAKAMEEALASSEDQLATMGCAGRNLVLELHDSLKEAEKLKELFRSVAKRGRN